MKPYVNDPEEVAVNFMSSLNKAIANYRDVDDGGAHYSSPTCSSESTADKFKSNIPFLDCAFATERQQCH